MILPKIPTLEGVDQILTSKVQNQMVPLIRVDKRDLGYSFEAAKCQSKSTI